MGNTSNSDNIGVCVSNCQNHPVRVRTEFTAVNHTSAKKASENKVKSWHRFLLTFITEGIVQNSPRASQRTEAGALVSF